MLVAGGQKLGSAENTGLVDVRTQGVRRDPKERFDSAILVLTADAEEHAHDEGECDELHQAFTSFARSSTTLASTSRAILTMASAWTKFSHGNEKW